MSITHRDITKNIVLSIVTCGIYGLYWAFCAAREMVNDPEGQITIEPILAIFLPCVGLFMAEKKFAADCARKGIAHEDQSVKYLIIGIFGIVGVLVDLYMIQTDLNQLATAKE